MKYKILFLIKIEAIESYVLRMPHSTNRKPLGRMQKKITKSL